MLYLSEALLALKPSISFLRSAYTMFKGAQGSLARASRTSASVKVSLGSIHREHVFTGRCFKRLASTKAQSILVQEDETMTLSNGHTMGYSICGSPSHSAPTIFFLHGYPSCRLEGLGLRKAAHRIGVRIITPDRPGLGLSTYDPHRRLLDYPDHIAQLARHHGLSEYRVLGGSGGGPYALACARLLPPQHLKGLGVLAGVGPMDPGMGREEMRLGTRFYMRLNQWVPGLLRWIIERTYVPKTQDPDPTGMRKFLEAQLKFVKDFEREYLESDPENMNLIIRMQREHFKQGAAGLMKESQLNIQPWGFRLEDVPFEGVKLWYGQDDMNTPAKMGIEMAKRLKHSRLKLYAGETHLTIAKYSEDILKELLEDPKTHVGESDPEVKIVEHKGSKASG